MAVQLNSIKNIIKAKIIETSTNARNSTTIDEALEKQAEGVSEAVKLGLQTFMLQASVDGGVCSPGGPITQAKIT